MEVVASLSQGRTAAAQCDLFTYKSVPVIFEPPCITIVIKSQQYCDYQHLKSHAMNTIKSREMSFVQLTNKDCSREPSILAYYLNCYRWHTSVHELALEDQTAAKCTCDCGKGNVS